MKLERVLVGLLGAVMIAGSVPAEDLFISDAESFEDAFSEEMMRVNEESALFDDEYVEGDRGELYIEENAERNMLIYDER